MVVLIIFAQGIKMKDKMKVAYMKAANIFGDLSYCVRRKVGCVIVRDDRIVSIGYNGTPAGWDNCCETEDNVTKPEVIHAESNAITKLAKCHESGKDADMFINTAPCIDCAKLIYQTGIRKVYYEEIYRSDDGLNLLRACGVTVEQVSAGG